MDLLELIGARLDTLIGNPIAAQALTSAIEGIVIGLVVGAIVWAIMQAPDTLGRALLIAIVLGIGMIIWEFARIGSVLGSGMGDIIESFNANPILGEMFLQAGVRTLIAMLIGAFIGVISQVPQWVIRGAIIGILLGAIVGAVLGGILAYFQVALNTYIYRGLVVVGIWAILATFSDRG